MILGIASLNVQGLQGALFQLLNFTIVAGGVLVFLRAGQHGRAGHQRLPVLLLGVWPGSVLELTRLASEGWVNHLNPAGAALL